MGPGTTAGIGVELKGGTIAVFVDGEFKVAVEFTIASGLCHAFVCGVRGTSEIGAFVNFGQEAFKFTRPSGFSPFGFDVVSTKTEFLEEIWD
jgi:hypothetical protein